jgi:hypothetical protein
VRDRAGYGSDAVWALARWLFAERGHHRITIDPAAAMAGWRPARRPVMIAEPGQ